MEFFKWKENFNIGIEDLDQQHRMFFEHLNDCYSIASAADHNAVVDSAMIAKLRQYATMHFHYEEELLRFVSYSDMERQQEQHIYFEKQVLALEAEQDAGTPRSFERVFEFLRDWFLKHILEEDMKFVPFVKDGWFEKKKK